MQIPRLNKHAKFCNTMIFLVSVFLFLLQFPETYAQQTKLMDFNVENEKLSTALYRFSNESGINLTYNAGDKAFDNIISFSAKNQLPLVILEGLLKSTEQDYKKIGNQIVLFHNPQKKDIKPEKEVKIKPVVKNVPVNPDYTIITDTVFVTDTIFILKTDTILRIDTVIVEKEKPIKAIEKFKDIPEDLFNRKNIREKGWAAEVFASPIISDYSLVKNKPATYKVSNYSFGLGIKKMFNRWNVGIAAGYTHFSEKFSHNYTVTSGGFYIQDTIDEYYTVSGIDTSYFYVTDSSWKPLETNEYTYDINNRIGYFEVMGVLSFDLIVTENIRCFIKGGLSSNFIVTKKGMAFSEGSNEGTDFSLITFESPVFVVRGSVGTKIKVHDKIDFTGELFYFSSFGDTVIDYPPSTKMKGMGLQLGLMFYF